MNYDYKKNFIVGYSMVDSNLKLGLVGAAQSLEDIMIEYFAKIGTINKSISKPGSSNWLITKARLHFINQASFRDQITANAYTTEINKASVKTEAVFKNQNGQVNFVGTLETCQFDAKTKSIRRINYMNFPSDMNITKAFYGTKFGKLDIAFNDSDFVYTIEDIPSSDIDYTGHVNNLNYVKYMISTFRTDQIKQMRAQEFEIQYLNESNEDEPISVYRKKVGRIYYFLIKNGDREIAKAKLFALNVDTE